MSGRVLIISPWPGLQILFYDFITGDATVLPNHHRALQRQVYPIVRQVKTRLNIVGSASRRGDAASINLPLSRARGENVLALIRRAALMDIRRITGRALGERVAGGGPNANHARDRSVGLSLMPLMDEQDANDPADEIRRAFRQIISARGNPPSSLSGEERAALWNPLDARLSGYGEAMRSYLLDLPPSNYGLTDPIPRGPFTERVRLNPRRIRNVRSRVQHHDTGQDDAYRVWNGFNPDQRWAVKHADRALDILADLCAAYRQSWAQHFGRGANQAWRPGMCGFLTAEEERRHQSR
jgi:hypothetical protein